MSSTVKLDARLVFSLDFELNPPMVVGSRIIYGFSGKATGGIVGELVAPSSDWITAKQNGAFDLNVNVVIKTSDGALIYQQMLGRSVRDADDPTNSTIRSCARARGVLDTRPPPRCQRGAAIRRLFETSAEKYKYLNNACLRGHGVKRCFQIHVDYYET